MGQRLLALGVAFLMMAGSASGQTVINPHGPSIGTCATCHTPNAWKPAKISSTFTHAARTFPLEGAHQTATCASCHKSLDFSKATTGCVSCHQDVHRTELGTDCARCHTARSFTDGARLSRLHEETQFPLRGAHVATACEACHTRTTAGQPQFANRSTTCLSCHQSDYEAAATPKHTAAGFPTTCSTCHTETAWRGAPFDHQATAFPLTGAHGTATCTSCHADGVYQGKPTTCASCHQPDFAATTTPPHGAASFSTDCTTCHTTARWDGVPFDHATTQFPLTGGHQAVQCATCHADGVYTGKPTTCVSCHQQDYAATTVPPHAAAGFATTCATCHNSTKWLGAPFDHQTTQFPLVGAHQPLACTSCHADGVYRGKPTACVACHRQNYDQTTTPGHAAAGYATDCTSCHGQTAWRGAGFDHNTTQFPLTGGHQALACLSCHTDGVFRGKASTCVSCHQPDFAATTTPPHAAAGFSSDCTSCHTTTHWTGAVFDHGTTQFPLTGGHVTTSCASCHADGVYRGKPTTCVSCHQPDFAATTTPPHAAAGFSSDCTSCHTAARWDGATFNHNTTQFPLTGGHLTATCASCHADGVYRGKPTTCVSCHRTDYDGTLTPSHAAAGYGTDCTTCHTTTQWQGANFDHGTTQFPLTGGHVTASCTSCHVNGVYRGTPTTCLACHQADFAATTTPPHGAAGFSSDCTTCHTTARWTGAVFNHSTTQFPLTGGHLTATCASCHADGVYRGKPTTCVSCHRTDYDGTRTPPHATTGYGTDCTTCHTTARWTGAVFNHSTTQFPLTGGHLTATCASCHVNGVYRGTPTTCVSCHQQDFAATTTPPHGAAGFSSDCTTCHTTARWTGAVFNHSTTQFPLTGGHLTATCASCHADGVYRGKPTICVSCHRTDYDGTRTPPHATTGYGTDCTTCHTTARWTGAVFNHSTTQFPLTGGHLTATCASCHVNGVYRGTPTTCVSCHQQDFAATTTPPHGAAGFSSDCTTCHTTARWTGAVFNHSTTQFPLTGAHLAVSCNLCHADGVYRGKPTTCVSCHQQDFNGTTSPPHGAAGFSSDCTTCHTTTRWTGAVFNHSTTQFPLTGAHVATPCASCHADGVYRGKPTTCVSCHQQDYNTATPNHAAAQFPTTCTSCHTTTRWDGATFNHDSQYFPIYSGAHRGRWTSCTTCHTSPTNFTAYTCMSSGCHSRSSTDSHHTQVRNYQYVATACYSCHPRGTH